MKKFLTFLFLGTLLWVACGPDEPELGKKKLVLDSSDTVIMSAQGGSFTISFYLENASFEDKIEYYETERWLLIQEMHLQKNGADGDLIGLASCKVYENFDETPREGIVYFTYQDQQIEVTIKQDGKSLSQMN